MIISIDGNIGCGKSTLLSHIEKRLPAFDVLQEPVDSWQRWLDAIYAGKKKGELFPFQVNVWKDRCLKVKPSQFTKQVIERSPLFQRHVFVDGNKDYMSKLQYDLLSELYELIEWEPVVYIYLRSDPDKCMERIAKRGRRSEDKIDAEYIHKLHRLHEECIESCGREIIIIDVEGKTPAQVAEEVLTAILSSI